MAAASYMAKVEEKKVAVSVGVLCRKLSTQP
jgi:hypothetical protein